MIELLSPAGNKEAFFAAIQSGADAIYMGLDKYNARAMTENLNIFDYIECIKYAHIYGVKVYLTMNILLYDSELEEAISLIMKLYTNGLDAVIVQDIGLAQLIKKYIPKLDIHASTQMTIHSLEQIKVFEKLGFKRVVLARELTFQEIEYIAKNTNVELEVFIHGALCVGYSGQCLMSSMIGNRSGNRGKCAGTCRLPFRLYKDKNEIANGYLLSKKDIYGIDYVNKLKDIGVKSLKIEGRGKIKEYVSLVTRKYRKCIDEGDISIDDEKQLMQIFNRSGKSFGYLNKIESKDSISYKVAKNTGLYLGRVLETQNNMIKLKLEEDIDMHDGVECFEEENIYSTIVTCIKDEVGNVINKEMKKGKVVWIGDFKNVPKVGSYINKTSSKKLLISEQEYIKSNPKKINVLVNLSIKYGEKINVNLNIEGKNDNMTFSYDLYPEKAKTRVIEKIDIQNCFDKTKDTPFNLVINSLDLDAGLFITVSNLNQLRRDIISKIIESFESSRDLKCKVCIDIPEGAKNNNVEKLKSLFIYKFNRKDLTKYNMEDIDYVYINIADTVNVKFEDILKIQKPIYLYIPNIILNNLNKYIKENLESIISSLNVKGILLGSINYLIEVKELKEKYNLKLIIDYSLNVNNIQTATFYMKNGADAICVSPELEESQIYNLSKICNIEIVSDYVSAMTTRYCTIKAFDRCDCKNSNYILKDSYNNEYHIITSDIDCISKLVRKIPNNRDCIVANIIRKCYI